MPVMPGVDDPTVPTADPGKEQAAAEPHADIVARLLDYQRRLREETGDKSRRSGSQNLDAPQGRAQRLRGGGDIR